MSDSPQVFAAIPRRPLLLANLLREKQEAMTLDGQMVPAPQRMFAGAVPVVLDGVSEWWAQQEELGPGKHEWEWPDSSLVANWRLPWPHVWAEYRDHFDDRGLRGLLMREHTLRPKHLSDDLRATLRQFYADHPLFSEGKDDDRFIANIDPDITACVTCLLFRSHHLQPTVPVAVGAILWLATREGRPSPKDSALGFGFGDDRQRVPHFGTVAIWSLFTALMGVKHLGVADIPIGRQERRAHERHRDRLPPLPWVSYKTLAIQLPRQAVQRFGVPLARPGVRFHLVRGHLADYSQGAGLFGRWRQVVWRSAHHRGFQHLGAISKTYSADVASERL